VLSFFLRAARVHTLHTIRTSMQHANAMLKKGWPGSGPEPTLPPSKVWLAYKCRIYTAAGGKGSHINDVGAKRCSAGQKLLTTLQLQCTTLPAVRHVLDTHRYKKKHYEQKKYDTQNNDAQVEWKVHLSARGTLPV